MLQVINKQVLIISLFFSFCNDSTLPKESLIPVNDMKKILKERQWIIASINTYHYDVNPLGENVDSLLASVHQVMGYSNQEFQHSWNFYLHEKSNQLLMVCDEIIQDFQMDSELIND